MSGQKRRRRILFLLEENEAIYVSDLAQELDVSDKTIRRDLQELEEEGLLLRFRGGAKKPEKVSTSVSQMELKLSGETPKKVSVETPVKGSGEVLSEVPIKASEKRPVEVAAKTEKNTSANVSNIKEEKDKNPGKATRNVVIKRSKPEWLARKIENARPGTLTEPKTVPVDREEQPPFVLSVEEVKDLPVKEEETTFSSNKEEALKDQKNLEVIEVGTPFAPVAVKKIIKLAESESTDGSITLDDLKEETAFVESPALGEQKKPVKERKQAQQEAERQIKKKDKKKREKGASEGDKQEEQVKPRKVDKQEGQAKQRKVDKHEGQAKPGKTEKQEEQVQPSKVDKHEGQAKSGKAEKQEEQVKPRKVEKQEEQTKASEVEKEKEKAKSKKAEKQKDKGKRSGVEKQEEQRKGRRVEKQEEHVKPKKVEKQEEQTKSRTVDRQEEQIEPRKIDKKEHQRESNKPTLAAKIVEKTKKRKSKAQKKGASKKNSKVKKALDLIHIILAVICFVAGAILSIYLLYAGREADRRTDDNTGQHENVIHNDLSFYIQEDGYVIDGSGDDIILRIGNG